MLLLLLPAACRPTPSPNADPTATTGVDLDAGEQFETATQITPAITHTALPSTTPTQPDPFHLCSPLRDIPLEQLAGMVSNPYHPPVPGSDDPHMGVDLADTLPGSQVAVSGREVNAILPGVVAAINPDRFPYGKAVLVETRLESLPADWLAAMALPTPQPSPPAIIALSCPEDGGPAWNASGRSLYIFYAHLQETAPLQPGSEVDCGERLGAVGMSGNALNPHLHLEMRVGPSGLRFASMAHYDASASLEEMAAYCAWRISGGFQLIDPLALLTPDTSGTAQ